MTDEEWIAELAEKPQSLMEKYADDIVVMLTVRDFDELICHMDPNHCELTGAQYDLFLTLLEEHFRKNNRLDMPNDPVVRPEHKKTPELMQACLNAIAELRKIRK